MMESFLYLHIMHQKKSIENTNTNPGNYRNELYVNRSHICSHPDIENRCSTTRRRSPAIYAAGVSWLRESEWLQLQPCRQLCVDECEEIVCVDRETIN